MIILILLLILFSPLAHAEIYAIEKNDGTIEITESYIPGGVEKHIKQYGLENNKTKLIKTSDLPPDRTYRDAWVFNDSPVGKKIMVDQQKKKAIDDAKTAKQNEKQAIFTKLGVSEEELKKVL